MGMWTKKESGQNNGHLSWDFPSSEEDDELDLFTEGQLTSLVRTSYLRYLERCLFKNCEECHTVVSGDKARISRNIAHHARILERKALRACMKADVYQRTIVQIMDQIKKSTKTQAPFVNFEDCPRLGTPASQVERETQTDFVDEASSKRNELADFLNNAFGLNPSDPDNQMDSTELLNILMSPQDPPGPTASSSQTAAPQPRPMNLDERLQALGLLADDIETPAPMPPCPEQNIPFIDDNPSQPPAEVIPKLPFALTWAEELVVQMSNLNRILKRLSPSQVAVIEKRFRDLFGRDFPVVEVTDEQKSVCRKRTANLVVAALTPYYIQKRIASKELFKNLAKSVTDRLMSRSYAPDVAAVKKEIKLIFWNKKDFKTLKDIDF